MDTDSLARQVEGVERSVVFLRGEQLALLHGLHLEILSLQKRCAELTRELSENPPGRTQAEVEEEEQQLEGRCKQAEGRLEEQQDTLAELRRELSHKGALVGALRASLKDKERRFLEELKRRSHRSALLNAELQKQTEVAAYLSFQLHSARQRLHQQPHHHHHLHQQQQQQQQQQQASASPPPSVRPKRRHQRHLLAERARECVPRERIMGPAEPTAMPDPALFLQPRRRRPHPRPHRPHAGQGGSETTGEIQAPEGGATNTSSTATETEAE